MHLAIAIHAARLIERTLVGLQAEPLHAVENDLRRLVGGALAVGVLDAQDERAAVTARVQPREQRRAHAADVQHAGRAGSETGTDGHGATGDRIVHGRRQTDHVRSVGWWAVQGLNL